MSSDDELLRGLCEGNLGSGDELWVRRVDANVDQRLLTSCAGGDGKAIERFAGRYLVGLDAGLVRQARDRKTLVALCERQSEDLPLLARYAAGNKTAGEALFKRYYPVLDRFVASKVRSSDEAADIVQETFRDLARQHKQIQSFRPFMFRVAVNKIGAWYKKQYKKQRDGVVDTGISGISDLPEAKGIETREEERIEQKLLVMALQGLPLNEQMVLELYTWEDFTADEVAEIFGFQLHNVRHMLRRAKEKMREFIGKHGHQGALLAPSGELARFVAELQENIREHLPDKKPVPA